MTPAELNGWIWLLLKAAGTTVLLVAVAFPLALLLGSVIARCQLSDNAFVRFIGRGYSNVLRGVPELLIIYLVFFGGSQLATSIMALFGGGRSELNSFASGTVAVMVIGAAYIAESLRGAFQAIPKGQFEAATAFGMTPLTRLRRVTAPLVFGLALPSLGNNIILLIKQTSLVSVTGLVEVMRQAQIGAGSTRQPFVFYTLAAVIFLVLIGLAQLGVWLAERRMQLSR